MTISGYMYNLASGSNLPKSSILLKIRETHGNSISRGIPAKGG
jgi:hypothetical protein